RRVFVVVAAPRVSRLGPLGGRGPHMVGDVGGVAVLVLLPPPGGDDARRLLMPVFLPHFVHRAASCLKGGGWKTGASGSDGGALFLSSSSDERSEIGGPSGARQGESPRAAPGAKIA